MITISPIERVTVGGREVVLKREDLLPRGGGNKVHRFDAFFARVGHVRRLVALSEPGAHSLCALTEYLAPPGSERGAESLLLLELDMAVTPYAKRMQARYQDREGIAVRSGPLWKQGALLLWHRLFGRFRGTRTVGVGGTVRLHPNPYAEVWAACRRQLDDAGLPGPAVHVFPSASGQMARGFLRQMRRDGSADRLVGVTTGPAVSRAWLRVRHAFSRRLRLHPSTVLDDEGYRALAARFHDETGVWLDPRHTIQLAVFPERAAVPADHTVVLWITCPRVSAPSA